MPGCWEGRRSACTLGRYISVKLMQSGTWGAKGLCFGAVHTLWDKPPSKVAEVNPEEKKIPDAKVRNDAPSVDT